MLSLLKLAPPPRPLPLHAGSKYNFGRLLARHWQLPQTADPVTSLDALRQYNYYSATPAASQCMAGRAMVFTEAEQDDVIRGNGTYITALTGKLSVAFERFDFLTASSSVQGAGSSTASSTTSRAAAVACAFDLIAADGALALMRMSTFPGSSNMAEVRGSCAC